MKGTIRLLSFLSVLVLIFTAVGVSATWTYIYFTDLPEQELPIQLLIPEPVQWENKDELPPEHARLVELFVQEINDPDSIIHDRMTDRLAGFLNINWFGQKDELGSMDEDGAELRKLFSCENSHFIVKMDAKTKWVGGFFSGHYENTYYGFEIYTTETDLSTLKSGDWVEDVYKTTFQFNKNTNEWEVVESMAGRAPYSSYDAEWSSERIPAFDVDKWQRTTTAS